LERRSVVRRAAQAKERNSAQKQTLLSFKEKKKTRLCCFLIVLRTETKRKMSKAKAKEAEAEEAAPAERNGPADISALEAHGISAGDVKKLQAAGM
jgi:hypothetical protein